MRCDAMRRVVVFASVECKKIVWIQRADTGSLQDEAEAVARAALARP